MKIVAKDSFGNEIAFEYECFETLRSDSQSWEIEITHGDEKINFEIGSTTNGTLVNMWAYCTGDDGNEGGHNGSR